MKYYNTAGDQQTLDESLYDWDADRIVPTTCWPTTYPKISAVEIEVVVGYESVDDVPTTTKQAILMLAGHLYENREATVPLTVNVLPLGVKELLDCDSRPAF